MQVVPKISASGAPAAPAVPAMAAPAVQAEPVKPGLAASGGSFMVFDLTDPRLADVLRGYATNTGLEITVERAMQIPAVYRSVCLISQSIGMLPLQLIDKASKERVKDHDLYRILHRKPNKFQTSYEFRELSEVRRLVRGNAYARILKVRDFRNSRDRITDLIPLDPLRMTPKQSEVDFSVSYEYQQPKGGKVVFAQEDILHIRGQSDDGIVGVSLVKRAADAISLQIAANVALGRLYKRGSFVDGYISHPKSLDPETMVTLAQQWEGRYSGVDNAGRTPVFEEGMEYKALGMSPKDSQTMEMRAFQIHECARVFGIPRPLLMLDETNWGTGIDVLGQFFVRYALGPGFEAWQQRMEFSLLSDADSDKYEIKFNAGGLLRGSLKDQGEYFAKALGSGGTQAWMTPNEVRDVLDMTSHADGDKLGNPMTAPAASEPTDPANPPANPAPKEPTDG